MLKNIKEFVFNKYYSTVKFFCSVYFNVVKFFCSVYSNVVGYLTNTLMSWTFSMMQYSLNLRSNDKDYIEYLATRFSWMTAQTVRQVVVLRGKDPDYIAPVPQPTLDDIFKRKHKIFGGPPYEPAWVSGSFTDIKKHPVIASRLALEAVKNMPTVVIPTVTGAPPAVVTPTVVPESKPERTAPKKRKLSKGK